MSAIHSLLTLDTVRVGLAGETKESIIEQLVMLLEHHPTIIRVNEVLASVLEREEVMSTGVGKGLALPHAKTPAARSTVAAFGITAHPVDFGSIDNQPVRLVFLLVGSEATKSQHIRILSRVSRLMNRDDIREQLLAADSSQAVLDIFKEAEAQLLEH